MKTQWRIFLGLVAAVALAAAGRAVYMVYRAPSSAFATPRPTQTAQTASRATPTPAPTLSPEEALYEQADTDFMAGRVNILLVGFDESPERDEEGNILYRGDKNGFRSDVLLLVAVNFAQNTAHLISIPRDTYSPIYATKGRWKINAAFAKGGGADKDGFLYAQKTVELLFGVPVDYYAGVNMAGLKKLVDAMGGVDYDVDVAIRLNGRTLETGFQHLTGQQVLDYCRARKGISTDVGRNDRQQRMLLSIFRQLQSEKRLTDIPALYLSVKDDLYTNLSLSQIAALAAFGLRLPVENIRRSTLEGEYVSNVYNASYYVLENKKLIALVKEEFGVEIKRDKKYDLATVKRDKAAAEAKKAAQATPAVEGMAALPADTLRVYDERRVFALRVAAERVLELIELDAPLSELKNARHALMVQVRAFSLEYGVECGEIKEFRTLRME